MWTELERLAGMPGWLVALDDPAALRDALSRHVPGLRDAKLRSIRFKPGAWRAGCELRLWRSTDGDGETAEERLLVTATIRPPVAGGLPPTTGSAGARPGAPGWQVIVPELRLDLTSAEPDAAALPALRLLTDPGPARAFLEDAIRAGTPAYQDLRILAAEPHVMRYSPGSRCTVLYRLQLPDGPRAADWPDVVVAKTYHRADKGLTAWDGMRALWTSPLGSSTTVTIAEPLAWRPDERILVQGPVRGRQTLKELLLSALQAGPDAPLAELRECVGKAAAGLAELHSSGVRTGRTATWDEELAEVREVASELADAVPELSGAAEPFLRRLEQMAAAVPPDPAVPSHRSFRPAQVLLDGDRIGFIDFDGFCQAEPALDVALFRATVRDVSMSALPDDLPLASRLATVDDLCDHFLRCYDVQAPVSRRRVDLWEALDLLTNVLHSWTKVKPDRLVRAYSLLRHHALRLMSEAPAREATAQVDLAAGT